MLMLYSYGISTMLVVCDDLCFLIVFFKQKTAYDMRISDWSSDVCSSDLGTLLPRPDESVEWDGTRNLLIEGDNLEVLKLLQKSYNRKIKAIYIDPPYNTGRNLIYPNDYHDGVRTYLEVTGQVEGEKKLQSNPESGGRFHTNWLSMIYPRLKLARNLLAPDGVLVITIDDNEVSHLGDRKSFVEGKSGS